MYLPSSVRHSSDADEERRRRAGRILAARHRDDAEFVRRVGELASLQVADQSQLSRRERRLAEVDRAGLDDEARRDAVHERVVVDARLREPKKLPDGLGRFVGHHLELERAQAWSR